MDHIIRATASRWLTERRAAVVVEVTHSQGSVPREAGTRMLVSQHDTIGTIGGGHLELKSIAAAREMLRTGELGTHAERFPLGPALGQCCGGVVDVAYHALDATALEAWRPAPPLFRLQLHGAGHVGRAVSTLLATLACEVDWIDERDDEFPATTTLGTPWPAQIRRIAVDESAGEVDLAKPDTCYLVMTHQHDIDMRITEAILRRGDFAWLGLIGSKTKRQRFVHRFEQRGIAADRVARMHCPIGVDGIVGKEPELIALAVVAQLLQATTSERSSDGCRASADASR